MIILAYNPGLITMTKGKRKKSLFRFVSDEISQLVWEDIFIVCESLTINFLSSNFYELYPSRVLLLIPTRSEPHTLFLWWSKQALLYCFARELSGCYKSPDNSEKWDKYKTGKISGEHTLQWLYPCKTGYFPFPVHSNVHGYLEIQFGNI